MKPWEQLTLWKGVKPVAATRRGACGGAAADEESGPEAWCGCATREPREETSHHPGVDDGAADVEFPPPPPPPQTNTPLCLGAASPRASNATSLGGQGKEKAPVAPAPPPMTRGPGGASSPERGVRTKRGSDAAANAAAEEEEEEEEEATAASGAPLPPSLLAARHALTLPSAALASSSGAVRGPSASGRPSASEGPGWKTSSSRRAGGDGGGGRGGGGGGGAEEEGVVEVGACSAAAAGGLGGARGSIALAPSPAPR